MMEKGIVMAGVVVRMEGRGAAQNFLVVDSSTFLTFLRALPMCAGACWMWRQILAQNALWMGFLESPVGCKTPHPLHHYGLARAEEGVQPHVMLAFSPWCSLMDGGGEARLAQAQHHLHSPHRLCIQHAGSQPGQLKPHDVGGRGDSFRLAHEFGATSFGRSGTTPNFLESGISS